MSTDKKIDKAEQTAHLKAIKATASGVWSQVRKENQAILEQLKTNDPTLTAKQLGVEGGLLLRDEKLELFRDEMEAKMASKDRRAPCWIDTLGLFINDALDRVYVKKELKAYYAK